MAAAGEPRLTLKQKLARFDPQAEPGQRAAFAVIMLEALNLNCGGGHHVDYRVSFGGVWSGRFRLAEAGLG